MKIAIIGSGKLIPTALEAIGEVSELTPVALFVRPQSREKGETLARTWQIPRVCTDYDALLADPEIDGVYIALVNSAHYDYAKRALLAGKHVLLEKPFTSTAGEAQELRDLALQRRVVLIEAITPRHALTYHRLRETLPRLGAVRLVLANYAQYSSRYDAYLHGEVHPAFDSRFQGGALYDLNIYNISILVGLFGRPKFVRYRANRGFNGVDTSGTLLCGYPGFTASLSAAKDSTGPCFFLVQGERGWARIEGPPNEAAALTVCLDGQEEVYHPTPEKNRMVREFRDFVSTITLRDFDGMREELDRTVTAMEVVEAALSHAD